MKITLALVTSFALLSAAVYVATPAELKSNIPDSGVSVVEFNASFNASNSVEWIEDLNDCQGQRVDIVTTPDMQKEHKIVVVPTIIVFSEGEEIKRFQANIMMQLEATQDEVQEAVDEIIMSSF
jgi:hypothetical protein